MTKDTDAVPVFVIPPYILNSTFGSKLQHALKAVNSSLAENNIVATDSIHYAPATSKQTSLKNKFSSDPVLHGIIKEKLLYKLATIGVFGTSPPPIDSFSDAEAYELFSTFETRLMAPAEKDKSDAHTNGDNTDPEKIGSASKSSKNLFESDTLGEVELPIPDTPDLPSKYHPFYRQPLKSLLTLAKSEGSGGGYHTSSGFLSLNGTFDYLLPSLWVNIIPNSKLSGVSQVVDISSGFEEGIPVIEVTSKEKGDPPAALSSRYLNFITDREVRPSTGIYYYEVEIEQECTQATGLQPLLASLSSSLSARNAPHLCVGIVKRRIKYEQRNATSTGGGTVISSMDLELVKQDLKYSRDKTKPTNTSIETLLDAKPGEFKGSFALDLSDSNFYNSIKGSESAHRTTLLSMSRRLSTLSRQHLEELDPGKVNTEVKFSNQKLVDEREKVVTQSDVIGFGINFYSKSLFITLNGVLITTITNEELVSSNSSAADLFPENTNESLPDGAVYPMIGFKLNDIALPENPTATEPTKLRIKTNLGFKQFKFNINNHVKVFKEASNKTLDLELLKQIQEIKSEEHPNFIEKQLLNVDDNSELLNNLIKGYLYTEGYIETFNALNRDLEPLKGKTAEDDAIIEKSDGRQRQKLKEYFSNDKFDDILTLIQTEYQQLFADPQGKNLVFQVKLYKLIFLLKMYTERLTMDSDDFTFDHNTMSQLYNEAFQLATQLTNEYSDDKAKQEQIKQVSVLLLVKDMTGFNNVPNVAAILDEYHEKVIELSDKVNKKILKGLQFNDTSNLETIVKTVDRNIEELALDHNDDRFGLVNFEADYLDL